MHTRLISNYEIKKKGILQITRHIRYGLTPLPFGTLSLATSYMLKTLCEGAII
jgi:hypothetical protein